VLHHLKGRIDNYYNTYAFLCLNDYIDAKNHEDFLSAITQLEQIPEAYCFIFIVPVPEKSGNVTGGFKYHPGIPGKSVII